MSYNKLAGVPCGFGEQMSHRLIRTYIRSCADERVNISLAGDRDQLSVPGWSHKDGEISHHGPKMPKLLVARRRVL